MSTAQNMFRIYNFTLTVSSCVMISAFQDDNGQQLPAMRSIELVVRHFRRKLSNVCLLDYC